MFMVIFNVMKIIEVRDGFIKFEADKNTFLSSFVQIDGIEKSYVAQVIQIKRSGENSIAYAKILFLYDGGLQSYDKTLPSKDSEIKEFTFDILSNSIRANNPIIAGKTLGSKFNIIIDESAYDKKMLVSVDDKAENNILVRNLVKQFNNLKKNVIIIDTQGIVDAKKYIAGVDFKLPLDTASLAFMYEDCLNDATADSKSLIVEIFKDLAEYSRTVPFVPFEALKTIIDDMVDKSHIFKLLVLKNKLAKFDRLGYFAKNRQEVEALEKILASKCSVIDLSKLDTAFQNRYLAFIYEKLKTANNTQVILELSNVVSKKNIKNILSDEDVATTFITHSRFKYLNDIKNIFDNFIIFPSLSNNSIFNIYGTFLNAMSKGTCLIAGEAVNYIPLVSEVGIIDDTIDLETELQEISAQEEQPAEEETTGEETESAATEEEAPEIKDLELETVPEPPLEMFTNDEEENEESEISDEEVNEESEPTAIAEETPLETGNEPSAPMEYSDIQEIQDIQDSEETVSDSQSVIEELPEYESEPLEELSEKDLEDIKETEEIPLTQSFETEVHPSLEIEEYAPPLEESQEGVELDASQEDTELLGEEELNVQNEATEPLEELAAPIEEPELLEEPEEITELESNEPETIEVSTDFDLEEEIPAEEQENNEKEEEPLIQEQEVLPISDEDSLDFDEIVELDPSEADENDIVIDMTDDGELPEEVDNEIIQDVDKVFTTRKDDDISDTDLDFIDELNSDDALEEIAEPVELEELPSEGDDGILEEVSPTEQQEIKEEKTEESEILETRNSSTPIVPVYDADIPQEDMVVSDPIQQGDTVFHAKYGNGVVEKMIKYGNKTLFSINFDNIGRRLLDPTLTEIKKT